MGILPVWGPCPRSPACPNPPLPTRAALRPRRSMRWHRRAGRAHGAVRRLRDAGAVRPRRRRSPRAAAAACWPSTCTAAPRRRCSTSPTWARLALTGPGAAAALERLVPGDIVGLKPGRQRYTLLTNEAGGILDDLMVANLGEGRLFLVVNASRKDVDFAHIAAALPAGVQLEPLAGPRPAGAARTAGRARCCAGSCPRRCGTAVHGRCRAAGGRDPTAWSPAPATPARTGSRSPSPPSGAEALAEALLAEPEVAPAGLGARDSLRLEAGLCLYGNDIDETDLAGRGRADLDDRQAPPHGTGTFPAPPRSATSSTTARRVCASAPAGRPRAGPRRRRDPGRRDGTDGRHRHLRRLSALAECADRHGLRAPRPCRRRHRRSPCMVRGKPRCRPPSCRCPSSPIATHA